MNFEDKQFCRDEQREGGKTWLVMAVRPEM